MKLNQEKYGVYSTLNDCWITEDRNESAGVSPGSREVKMKTYCCYTYDEAEKLNSIKGTNYTIIVSSEDTQFLSTYPKVMKND